MDQKRIGRKTEYGFSLVLLLLFAGLTFFLCYRQAQYANLGLEEYHSDILAYMQTVQGIDSGYSFPYPVMFWIAGLFHRVMPIETAMALTIALAQAASFWLLRYYLGKYLLTGQEGNGLRLLAPSAAALALLLVSMLFVPNHELPGIHFYYVGVFTANPFHNATYAAARPFCILALFTFVELLDLYEKGSFCSLKGQGNRPGALKKSENKAAGAPFGKKAVCFSVYLLLATMTKPSFTIVFCGAAGLIMLYRLIARRGRNWKNTILLGCMFLPTFIDLLYQFGGVFSGTDSKGQEAGIGFGLFSVWREYCENYGLAIVLAIFFPLAVLVFHYRKLLTHTLYRFAWQLYGMGLVMFVLLYEKGFRRVDANFSWGYMMGIFFLMTASLEVLLEDTLKLRLPFRKDEAAQRGKLMIQWGAFALHLVCGLYYFYNILTGGSYY